MVTGTSERSIAGDLADPITSQRETRSEPTQRPPRWMGQVLAVAAIYNLVWGAFAILSPLTIFQWLKFDPMPLYPEFWQCIGMIVGVYGIGYGLAARDPFRHWPIVLVGLLGKILGPIGFVSAVMDGRLPARMGWTILTNDLIWWIPFILILWRSYLFHRSPSPVANLAGRD